MLISDQVQQSPYLLPTPELALTSLVWLLMITLVWIGLEGNQAFTIVVGDSMAMVIIIDDDG